MSTGDEEPAITILLADGRSLFREAVRAALQLEGDLEVISEVGHAAAAVEEADRLQPDVVIVDADLGEEGGGIATARAIKERAKRCRILVLSRRADESSLVQAVEAGASGYLARGSALAELIDAARKVHRGVMLIPPEMLEPLVTRLVARRRSWDQEHQRVARLTRRERQVLTLLATGADKETIARELVISPQTARTHIQNVLEKMGVHSRLEAAAFVIQNGMLAELAMPEYSP
jgi:DNA-binding NarL/FixJ family response regulator